MRYLALAPVLLASAGCAVTPPPPPQPPTVYAVPVYVVPNCSDAPGRCYWIEPPELDDGSEEPPQQEVREVGIAL
ncbi:hypothetical protein EGJ86_19235 [Pseudomonas sp. o96-267]|nr:hypothetical protein EGJ86_19235 [Pseudomonas sp. o96-267]